MARIDGTSLGGGPSIRGTYDAASLEHIFVEHEAVARATRALAEIVTQAVDRLVASLGAGGKVLLCGNGGSAADAQHLAAELVGRFVRNRRALPAIALTTDSSILTAVGNDFGYETVFARQVEALGRPGDVLFAISTSGSSPNVVAAMEQARQQGMHVIGMTGGDGGRLAEGCEPCLVVPSSDTARVQEMHILLGHAICQLVEQALC